MGKAWSDYMAKNAKREYEESDPMKIIDQLRAELAAVKEEQIATLTELQSFREHATALDAHIERLEKACKAVAEYDGAWGCDCEGCEISRGRVIDQCVDALAATPKQSLAAIKVKTLREVAAKLETEAFARCDGSFHDAAVFVQQEADEIEKGES